MIASSITPAGFSAQAARFQPKFAGADEPASLTGMPDVGDEVAFAQQGTATTTQASTGQRDPSSLSDVFFQPVVLLAVAGLVGIAILRLGKWLGSPLTGLRSMTHAERAHFQGGVESAINRQ